MGPPANLNIIHAWPILALRTIPTIRWLLWCLRISPNLDQNTSGITQTITELQESSELPGHATKIIQSSDSCNILQLANQTKFRRLHRDTQPNFRTTAAYNVRELSEQSLCCCRWKQHELSAREATRLDYVIRVIDLVDTALFRLTWDKDPV